MSRLQYSHPRAETQHDVSSSHHVDSSATCANVHDGARPWLGATHPAAAQGR